MKLSASIMAHPVRRDLVEQLLASLDRDVPVAWAENPEPSHDLSVVWRTARAAWELADPDADWHMLLQDDAVVAPDLIAGMEKGLNHVPAECVVQPYLGAERPSRFHIVERIARAAEHDAAWFVMRHTIWGVAIVVPTHSIAGMLEWCSQHRLRNMSDDMRVGRYYRDVLGWAAWYPWPSPVDHRNGPSILGHTARGRVAHRFMEHSVLAHDWTGPIFRAPATYARQHRKVLTNE